MGFGIVLPLLPFFLVKDIRGGVLKDIRWGSGAVLKVPQPGIELKVEGVKPVYCCSNLIYLIRQSLEERLYGSAFFPFHAL